MTDGVNERAWRRAPRWLKLAFAISLALNFLVIGLAAGAVLRFHQHGGDGRLMGAGHLLRSLPEESREAARAEMKARRPEIRALRDARREASKTLAATIGAEQFDRTAVDAGFATFRAADQEVRAAVHGMIGDLLADLTPSNRAKIAKGLTEHRWARWRERRRRRESRERD